MRQPSGHVARSAENTDEDGVADQDGDTEGEAKDPAQLAAARGKRPRPFEGRIYAIGDFSQLEVRRR
jgi:hypothetical protein